MTSKATIEAWFDRGRTQGSTHMIVVCDTFDHEDYPVYVKNGEDPHKIAEGYDGKNMQRIMEIYNLNMDKSEQLAQHRAFNF